MKIWLSLWSGDLYELPDDEGELLDEGQIPLLDHPKKNCKHCYGRGYTDYNIVNQTHTLCRCLKDKLNKELYTKINKNRLHGIQ